MFVFVLSLGVVVVAYVASFTLWHAPLWSWIWKAALAAGEFGIWFVTLPIGLGGIAAVATSGILRVVLLALCVFAIVALLRPIFSAWRMGRGLRQEMRAAFGERAQSGLKPFSFLRLIWHEAIPRVPVTTHVFDRINGVDLELDFFAAQNAPPQGAPCFIIVHGGGWDSGERTQLPEWNHRWATRGFAVADIDYRLAPGHHWPAQRDDALAALGWLKSQAQALRIDPTRFILLGRSAGGQIATAVAYGAQDPAIRAVISYYAPQDMEFAWSVSREDDALNSINLMRQYLGGPPDTPERRALYISASAQAMIGPDTPPTLLLHGVPDTLVWHRHSERLTAALRAAGVRHHFLTMPWATHAFDFNVHGPGGQLADYAIESFLRATVD